LGSDGHSVLEYSFLLFSFLSLLFSAAVSKQKALNQRKKKRKEKKTKTKTKKKKEKVIWQEPRFILSVAPSLRSERAALRRPVSCKASCSAS